MVSPPGLRVATVTVLAAVPVPAVPVATSLVAASVRPVEAGDPRKTIGKP